MFPAALSYYNNGLEEQSWACAALQETKGSVRGWVTEWREREAKWLKLDDRRRQERRRTGSSSHLGERKAAQIMQTLCVWFIFSFRGVSEHVGVCRVCGRGDRFWENKRRKQAVNMSVIAFMIHSETEADQTKVLDGQGKNLHIPGWPETQLGPWERGNSRYYWVPVWCDE